MDIYFDYAGSYNIIICGFGRNLGYRIFCVILVKNWFPDIFLFYNI